MGSFTEPAFFIWSETERQTNLIGEMERERKWDAESVKPLGICIVVAFPDSIVHSPLALGFTLKCCAEVDCI